MTSAQVVEMSVTNSSSFQNYPHPDDHTIRTNKTTHQGQASANEEQKQEHVPLSYKSVTDLNRSDLTIAGEVAGQAVQLLIDTGACVSAMDVQFFKTVYGQCPPKMTDGSLSTVQTINGDKLPVLGKITVPLHLDGREYPCDFHVTQNLAFDAILGRNFLQENRALIDLQRSSVTLKGTRYLGKQTSSLREAVIGTFFSQIPQQKDNEEKKVITPIADRKSFEPQNVSQNQKNKHRGFQWPLLVLILAVLYLLPVSHTSLTHHNDEPVPVQRLPKFLMRGTPDEINQVGKIAKWISRNSQMKENYGTLEC